MSKINILYCIEFLNPGGTEKQLMHLINGLDKNKFQPHLCCLRTSVINDIRKETALNLFNQMNFPKIQLDFVSFRTPSSWLQMYKLVRFIKNNNIHITQTYFQDPATFGLIASKIAGINKTVACFRDLGFWREPRHDFFIRNIYKNFAHYLANSKAVMNAFHEMYGLPLERFRIINNGIPAESLFPKLKMRSTNKKHAVVGILANLNRKVKRIDVFLNAANYVYKKIKDIRFIIVGDGELKAELKYMCEELGLTDVVDFLGQVDNINPLLEIMDVGVLSSDSEGFSNAILEYMAAGIPVVATEVGGNMECITNGSTGYLVPCGDFVSMGDKIIELLKDVKKYHQIQQDAYQLIKNNYLIEDCVKKHQEFYISIIDERER